MPRTTGESAIPKPDVRKTAWSPGPRSDRTRAAVLAAAKQVFLERGYSGTRIEDIAAAAQVSRATFYVYYPSKRDVFLDLGTDSTIRARGFIQTLEAIPADWTTEHVSTFCQAYLDYLDEFGAWIRLWRQAAAVSDPELQVAGWHAELRTARTVGREFDRIRGRSVGDQGLEGAAMISMFEGLWYQLRLTDSVYDDGEVLGTMTALACQVLK